MKDRFFVLSEGVLGLRTSGEDLKWSFGINVPDVPEADFNRCAVRLRLSVGSVPGFASDGKLVDECKYGKYHYFSANHGDDALFYNRPFMFGSQLQFKISGLLTDEPVVEVNPAYFRYITHRFMNLHSVGYILTDLAVLLLLRKGFAPLHCSAFRQGGNTVIVFAPPNTGKTLTTMMACMEFGAEFIAEDIAITDGQVVYSVPWTSTFRYYSRVEQGRFARLLNSATKVMPLLELVPLSSAKPIGSYVESKKLLSRSEITDLVFLERGSQSMVKLAVDEADRKVVNLNRFEFNYHRAPAVVAYEFFNPNLDIDGAMQTERRILRQFVEKTEGGIVVQTEDASTYAESILHALSN